MKIWSNNPLIEKAPTLTNSSNNTSDASGLYKSKKTNSGKATYYFRGNVTNNYVKFAGFTWRIVRINEDGTVRIIMNDSINSNTVYKFSSNYTLKNYLWYHMSDIPIILGDSTSGWYKTNLYSFNISTTSTSVSADSKIVNSSFCGQFKVEGISILNYTPTFKCTVSTYDYSSLKIGLLTYDEAVFAGLAYGHNNSSNYLANGQHFWTMSPAGIENGTNYNQTFAISPTGLIYPQVQGNTATIRPVINLSPTDVSIIGVGTSTNPYLLS